MIMIIVKNYLEKQWRAAGYHYPGGDNDNNKKNNINNHDIDNDNDNNDNNDDIIMVIILIIINDDDNSMCKNGCSRIWQSFMIKMSPTLTKKLVFCCC